MSKIKYYIDKNVISFIILGFATHFIGLTWLSGFLFGATMGYLFMLNVAKALREKIDGLIGIMQNYIVPRLPGCKYEKILVILLRIKQFPKILTIQRKKLLTR